MKSRKKSRRKKRIIIDDGGEKINHGKNSYKEYLKEYKRKTRGERTKLMREARETIKKLRSSKEYNTVIVKDYDFDFF
ncbi:MAG: hypothetical protein WC917_00160 [Bacilli bacterium]|jgi:Skp family chaperone for outer membrane proteins